MKPDLTPAANVAVASAGEKARTALESESANALRVANPLDEGETSLIQSCTHAMKHQHCKRWARTYGALTKVHGHSTAQNETCRQ